MTRENPVFAKTITHERTYKSQNTSHIIMVRCRKEAPGPSNLSGPSSGRLQHPSSGLSSRSRIRRRTTNLRLARGADAPSGNSPPRSRPPWARDSRAHSPDQSIKCSGTPRAPGSKVNPCHASPLTPPRNRIPALFRQPSPCDHPWHYRGTMREGWCQLCDTVPPTPVRLHATPLEGGRRNPRKGYGRLPRTRTGWRHDIRLVEHNSSANTGPVRPSPPLYCHPRHCSTIPGAVGAQDDEMLPRALLCILQPSVSRTLEPAYGRRPNGKLPHDHP
jgi:hypothetical protein